MPCTICPLLSTTPSLQIHRQPRALTSSSALPLWLILELQSWCLCYSFFFFFKLYNIVLVLPNMTSILLAQDLWLTKPASSTFPSWLPLWLVSSPCSTLMTLCIKMLPSLLCLSPLSSFIFLHNAYHYLIDYDLYVLLVWHHSPKCKCLRIELCLSSLHACHAYHIAYWTIYIKGMNNIVGNKI